MLLYADKRVIALRSVKKGKRDERMEIDGTFGAREEEEGEDEDEQLPVQDGDEEEDADEEEGGEEAEGAAEEEEAE